MVVHPPLAAPGYDTSHIVYTQQPNRLQVFARHEWVDTPARMLTPLVVAALERGGAFSAVVLAPSAATGSMQLDLQLLRLQHEFGPLPSRVRLVLRAQLIQTSSRQVMATREFEQVAQSLSEDAPGGVAAAQQAVHALLDELARWCQGVASTPYWLGIPPGPVARDIGGSVQQGGPGARR
jgi:cholesterol transport system auxiliary component